MAVEVLVATMNLKRHYEILEKMNIQSSAIIANQCKSNNIERVILNGNDISFLSFKEIGIGLNRNNALMRASKDFCLLADDDLVYVDNYAEIVETSFKENPDADVIIFNIHENPIRRFVIKKKFRVRFFNFMRFGAVRVAFRRRSIEKKGIYFNQMFGGGSIFGSGEDTLFLNQCLNKKLNIIAVPSYIAYLTDDRESSWFKGYNTKYFEDKGALNACISNRWAKLLSLQFCLRHKKLYKNDMGFIEVYKIMLNGIKKYRDY